MRIFCHSEEKQQNFKKKSYTITSTIKEKTTENMAVKK